MSKILKKSLLKDSASTSVGTIISMIFHFVSIIVLTRFLTKDEFGIYILVIVMVNMFTILTNLGLNITLVKFVSSERGEADKAAPRAILYLRLVSIIAVTALFFPLSGWIFGFFDERLSLFTLYIPIFFAFSAMRDFFYYLLQGLTEFKKYALVQIISAAVRTAVIVLLLIMDQLTLLSLIYVELITSGATLMVQYFLVPFKNLFGPRPVKETYKNVIQFSFPIYLNNILTFSYDRISIFILGIMLNPAAVALYDVANKIPEALIRVFRAFIVVYFPNLAKLFSAGDKDMAEKVLNKTMILITAILSSLSLISYLFMEEIILLLFSETYAAGAVVFSILMFVLMIRSISNIMGYSLVSAGYSNIPVQVNIIASIVNIGFAFLFIPMLGVAGAALALVIMNIVSQLMYQMFLNKKGIKAPAFGYLKPILISIAFAGFYYLTGVEYILLKVLIIAAHWAILWYTVSELQNLITSSAGYIYRYVMKLSFFGSAT